MVARLGAAVIAPFPVKIVDARRRLVVLGHWWFPRSGCAFTWEYTKDMVHFLVRLQSVAEGTFRDFHRWHGLQF
jgi:hypothetical protein